MKNTLYKIGIFAFVLSLTLTSCTKDTQNKLIGEWRLIPIDPSYIGKDHTWEFTSDGLLIVRELGLVVSEGKYTVSATLLETKLITTEMTNNFNYYEAEWTIIELKRNTMYIVNDKDGGLYNREFERD